MEEKIKTGIREENQKNEKYVAEEGEEEQTTYDEGLESDEIQHSMIHLTDDTTTEEQHSSTNIESEIEYFNNEIELTKLNENEKNENESDNIAQIPEFEDNNTMEEDEGIEEEFGSSEQHDDIEIPLKQIPQYLNMDKEKAAFLRSEYIKLVMAIESQNRTINHIKNKITEKCHKYPRLKNDDREIRNLRYCLESENLKLQCLIKKAFNMQQIDSKQKWEGIPLPINLDNYDDIDYKVNDDFFKKYNYSSNDTIKSTTTVTTTTTDKDTDESDNNCPNQKSCLSSTDYHELEKFIDCIVYQMNKTKNKSDTLYSSSCSSNEEIKLSHKFNDFISQQNYNMQEKLVTSNSNLEKDRYKLQEEILCKDRIIDCLQQKIQLIQSEICKKRRDQLKNFTDQIHIDSTPSELKNIQMKNENLQKNMNHMKSCIERLKIEMDCLKREQEYWDNHIKIDDEYQENDDNHIDSTQRLNKLCSESDIREEEKIEIEKIRKIQQAYDLLLADYNKKDSELKYLKEKYKDIKINQQTIKNIGNNTINTNDELLLSSSSNKKEIEENKRNIKEIEIKLLHEKLNDLIEEQEEFKFLINEQQQQLNDIRCKYIQKQQKIEEQKYLLNKYNMNSERIEEIITDEIQRITMKFQQKSIELMKYPKILEQEQLKLSKCIKHRNELKQKLNIVCKEYEILKQQQQKCSINNDDTGDGPNNIDWLTKIQKIENEIQIFEEKCEIIEKNKKSINEKFQKAQNDYELLKNESARIIAQLKEKTEQQKHLLIEHSNKLEKELAQCRAASIINISERDELIKNLQIQINNLTFNFEAATEKITSLQNQITYLSCMNR